MSKLIGEQKDGKPPQVVLDDWMRKVGPSISDPTLPRCWVWNGVVTYASYADYCDD